MVATTVFVFVLITETLLESAFVMYTRFVAGFTATSCGFVPTAMVDCTPAVTESRSTKLFVLVSITETVPEAEFAT